MSLDTCFIVVLMVRPNAEQRGKQGTPPDPFPRCPDGRCSPPLQGVSLEPLCAHAGSCPFTSLHAALSNTGLFITVHVHKANRTSSSNNTRRPVATPALPLLATVRRFWLQQDWGCDMPAHVRPYVPGTEASRHSRAGTHDPVHSSGCGTRNAAPPRKAHSTKHS